MSTFRFGVAESRRWIGCRVDSAISPRFTVSFQRLEAALSLASPPRHPSIVERWIFVIRSIGGTGLACCGSLPGFTGFLFFFFFFFGGGGRLFDRERLIVAAELRGSEITPTASLFFDVHRDVHLRRRKDPIVRPSFLKVGPRCGWKNRKSLECVDKTLAGQLGFPSIDFLGSAYLVLPSFLPRISRPLATGFAWVQSGFFLASFCDSRSSLTGL